MELVTRKRQKELRERVTTMRQMVRNELTDRVTRMRQKD